MKDVSYYESLDKRTKEYKEWKASFEEAQTDKTEGLGDVVAKVTKATGFDKLAEQAAKALGYDDCGCDKRKEKLNKLFPIHRQPECPTEDEYNYLVDFFSVEREKVVYADRVRIYEIYNRVFRRADRPTTCTACFNEKVKMLKNLL